MLTNWHINAHPKPRNLKFFYFVRLLEAGRRGHCSLCLAPTRQCLAHWSNTAYNETIHQACLSWDYIYKDQYLRSRRILNFFKYIHISQFVNLQVVVGSSIPIDYDFVPNLNNKMNLKANIHVSIEALLLFYLIIICIHWNEMQNKYTSETAFLKQ